MAANRVGGIQFDVLDGRPVPPGVRVESLDRAGEDGTPTRHLGEKAPEVPLVSYSIHNDAAASDAAIASCQALLGTLVTVDDAFGIAHANVQVLAYTPVEVRNVIHEGAAKSLVIGQWVVRATE